MTKLPTGWARATLGDLVLLSQAKADPRTTSADKYIGLEHINKNSGTINGVGEPSQVRSTKAVFRKGDLLYGKLRPYLNKVWLAQFDGVCSTDILVFSHLENVNHAFLKYRLLSQDFVKFAQSRVRGMQHPRVSFKSISDFPIDLPPLNEQKRIVARLEELFSELDVGVREARATLDKVRQHREAVLRDAFNGELSRTWREQHGSSHETAHQLLARVLRHRRDRWVEDKLANLEEKKRVRDYDVSDVREPVAEARSRFVMRYKEPEAPDTEGLSNLPEGWLWTNFAQVSERVTVGYVGPMKGEYRKSGIPFLRSQNVRENRFSREGLTFISGEFHRKIAKSALEPGDLVVVRSGAVGVACVIPDSLEEANCSDLVVVKRPMGILPEFGSFYLNSVARGAVRAKAVGIALTHFNTRSMAEMAIPLPPMAEQKAIVREVGRHLALAEKTEKQATAAIAQADKTRHTVLHDALDGRLLPQDPKDEPALILLGEIRDEKVRLETARRESARVSEQHENVHREPTMKAKTSVSSRLIAAFERLRGKPDAKRLFEEAGYEPAQVLDFYEALHATPEVRAAFDAEAKKRQGGVKPTKAPRAEEKPERGCFRLDELWLEDFKNLTDYRARFDPGQATDVLIGWNGTGKSNLFEALVIIFRDLHNWRERNRWPEKPMKGYHLRYWMDNRIIEVLWDARQMKRPSLRASVPPAHVGETELGPITRAELPLPRFVFGYYSGPTNRLAEHFLPMKQEHYVRLREAEFDDSETLTSLLEQRRFFCAETHHAKYVLLAFFYRQDPDISHFLEERLRIVGFESALFIVRKPRWARKGHTSEDFWGAKGIMRRVLERLRKFAIAPMVIEQVVSDGYRTTREDHYYFFLPDLPSLHAFAAEYDNARTFFVALESTDFSELIHDVKVQVRVKATNTRHAVITFHELSEGEQQLLMVLGLMRFTKSHQSLVLLDEPDTHLNPHWSARYLKDLAKVMSEAGREASEQQTSQILISTHDPLVIASLVKEQVHLLKRDWQTDACKWVRASVNPRGLGFTGILTSEMFGFRSDLDEETLADLDNKVRLVAKEGQLTPEETAELETVNKRLEQTGFEKAFSDPYYAAFVRAWARRHYELMAGQTFLSSEQKEEIDRIAREVLEEAVAEVEKETTS